MEDIDSSADQYSGSPGGRNKGACKYAFEEAFSVQIAN
jgi:hypothetical protein